MRSMAGAVVVLAGSVLAAAGEVVPALPRGGKAEGASVGGTILILIGLAVFVLGLFSPERRGPTAGPPSYRPRGE